MTDQELSRALIEKTLLSEEEASRLLQEAQVSKAPLEEILSDRRVVPDEEVAKAKSKALGVPYKKVDVEAVSPELLKLIPQETSVNYKLAPIEKKANMLVVGMVNPLDERAQEALRFIAKRERLSLGVYLISLADLRAVWKKYKPYNSEIDELVTTVSKSMKGSASAVVSLDEGARSSEDAPVIKIVAKTLQQAVDAQASDIHIEPSKTHLRIRFRLDGELKEVASLPPILAQPITSRVKVLANLRLDENRIPQDGRFRTIISSREIDFRVATFPVPAGEKIVLRVLDPLTGLKGLESLGFEEYNFEKLARAVEAPYGMVLVSGPTGSGKSTTLYAVLQKIDTLTQNVVTLEDPVEYTMDGINQSQVHPEIGYSFASGLRQILRQDPDVIMVGEIRDDETASLAVNAALTGHVVLSTIHTNNALGVIPRMLDLGVPKFLLSSALHTMLAQRLLGKLCPNCKKAYEAPAEAAREIADGLKRMPADIRAKLEAEFPKPYQIYRVEADDSCKVCKGKGIAGRIAIAEVFQMTRELGSALNESFSEEKLLKEAERQGMISMRQDGIVKALRGEVLIEEVLRETE
jgi:type IV pilus assembly protein PilB